MTNLSDIAMDPALIFLHIPKTGGVSVSLALAARFAPDEVFHVQNPGDRRVPIFGHAHGTTEDFASLPMADRSRFRLLLGHLHYGFHQVLPCPADYFTLLRDPVERALSSVGQRNRGFRDRPGDSTEPLSVEQAIGLFPRSLTNHQARRVLGLHPHVREPTREDLPRVFRTLEKRFRVVGTTERWEESMELLAASYGWPSLATPRENVGADRVHREELHPDTLRWLEEHNELDREIYEFANARLTDQIKLRCRSRLQVHVPEDGTEAIDDAESPAKPRILVDGTKLMEPARDGIWRYTSSLLAAIDQLAQRRNTYDIDVFLGPDWIVPLADVVAWTAESAPHVVPAARDGAVESAGESPEPRAEPLSLLPTARCWKPLKALVRRTLGQRCAHWLKQRLMRVHDAPRRSADSPQPPPAYDLVHLTLPNTWKLLEGILGPRVITVHDLSHFAFPEWQTDDNCRTLDEGLSAALDDDARLIAVSHFTRNELVDRYGLSPDDVAVTWEGCDRQRFYSSPRFQMPGSVRDKYHLPDNPYLLSVGTLEPRKNLLGIVRAFRQMSAAHPELDVDLVIAGKHGWGDLHPVAKAAAGCPRIRFSGFVAEQDLPDVYSGALGFCYVSHYEGFGLPALEAMSCRVPVIYGGTSAMPEVVGDGGLAVDPQDIEGIAQAMYRLATLPKLRDQLAQRALARSFSFDWYRTARETWDVYEQIIDGPREMTDRSLLTHRRAQTEAA